METADELLRVREITEARVARARLARERTRDRFHDYYVSCAKKLREQAAHTDLPKARESLLRMAASHERLAEMAQGNYPGPTAGGAVAPDTFHRDIIARQRETVRQTSLIAELVSNGHFEAAAEAIRALNILKHTQDGRRPT